LAVCAAVAAALLIPAERARAEDSEADDFTERVGALVTDLMTRESFIVPLFISNPTIGSGLGLAAALFYQLDPVSRPSSTSLGAYYTFNDSWIVALRQMTYFGEGKHRLNALAGGYSLNTDYFGIGYEAGSEGESIAINEKGYAVEPNYLRRVTEHFYAGIGYRYIYMDTSQERGPLTIPDEQEKVRSSALGGELVYDSRDNELNPRTGTHLEASAYVNRAAIGSDTDYEIYKIQYNTYIEFSGVRVLALRAMTRATAGQVPYFDLSRFGAGSDLRGYVMGQYRDHVMYAVQAEGRFPLAGRFGAVVFAGVGGIAPAVGEFRADELLPSVGTGLRFTISEERRITVGVDYAVGRDTDGWYARIGEAF
jgi:hypothetical protein